MLAALVAWLALVVAACSPVSRPILAEIFYDAVGDDTGFEFVEILNPSGAAASLAGLKLEAGDGSGAGRWTLRWTGIDGDSVAAGGRFVVGGERVAPPVQRVARLELQNGPDAVRLVWPDGFTEVVGFGAHEFAEYACGAAAADVPSGQSLARIPDRSNQGENALDFSAASPSPGRANQPERDLGWLAGTLSLAPSQPIPGAPARLTGRVVNRGRVALGAGEARVRVAARIGPIDRPLAEVALGEAVEFGDTTAFELEIPSFNEGKQTLMARLELALDADPSNDLDSLLIRVGPGPLEITEIQFHPSGGEGEWVEVRNRSAVALDLSAFRLSDRSGTTGRGERGSAWCPPESLAILAQDREALLTRLAGLDTSRVFRWAPWPSLNNSNDVTGVADAAILVEVDGTPCDRIDYSAAGVPSGASLERTAGSEWKPAAAPGTPLRPPVPPRAIEGRFEISPRRIDAASAPVRIAWSLPWPRARLAAELYDLSGARVGVVLGETMVAARGEREWRPIGLPPGLYVLSIRARSDPGQEMLHESRVLRLDGTEP